MTNDPVAVRVDALIQRVFEVDPAGFHDGTGRGDLERWDSREDATSRQSR